MKHVLKKLLRYFTTYVPVRGRHRLVNLLGARLSQDIELININNFLIQINHNDLYSRHVYYRVYEEHLINFLKKNIHSGDIVFDPGTNIGYITASCLGLVGQKGHVYSFEPSRICFNQMTACNKLDSLTNLTLHNAAISDNTGKQDFYDTPRVISRGFACLADVEVPKDGIRYMVQVHSVDDYCRDNGIERIKFLKLDIEGSELDALKGSQNMLSKKAIEYILVETEINKSIDQLDKINYEVIDLLHHYGYRPHLIKRNGTLVPVNLQDKDQFRSDVMWVPEN